MKKVLNILIVILFIISMHLLSRYTINNLYVAKYYANDYQSNLDKFLRLINIPESYIVYYNKGNSYYQLGQYENAISEYEISLKKTPQKRICDVRVNLVLAKLELINYEDEKNINTNLEEVLEILSKDNCATVDNNGKDDNSQTLYNEILNLLSDSYNKPDEKEEPKEDYTDDQDEKELEELLKKQQEDGSKDRKEINNPNDHYQIVDKYW